MNQTYPNDLQVHELRLWPQTMFALGKDAKYIAAIASGRSIELHFDHTHSQKQPGGTAATVECDGKLHPNLFAFQGINMFKNCRCLAKVCKHQRKRIIFKFSLLCWCSESQHRKGSCAQPKAKNSLAQMHPWPHNLAAPLHTQALLQVSSDCNFCQQMPGVAKAWTGKNCEKKRS